MTRFYVVYTHGWRIHPGAGSGGGAAPGVSATVIDRVTGNECGTFSSEKFRGMLGPLARLRARYAAERLASRLECQARKA